MSYELFDRWRKLPEKTFVAAGAPERKQLCATMRQYHGKLFQAAHHVCQEMPGHFYVWLNDIEQPEYWVMNMVGEVCGEQIDECPFCGADLKHGGGDAVLLKGPKDWWRRRHG